MMDVFELIKKGDVKQVKEFLSKNPTSPTVKMSDDAPDSEGNTALHVAVKNSYLESARMLLAAGASPIAVNGAGKKPIDLAKDADLKNILADKMGDPAMMKSIQMARIEFLRQIEAELPSTVPGVKSFILDMLSANQVFQDRCKDKIRELLTQKHQAFYKYRLLENAAGVRDRRRKGDFMTQVHTQQHLNEQQAATISYLQIQNSMSEPGVLKLEESYRKIITEFQDQIAGEIKTLNDRATESESRLNEACKNATNELNNLKKENGELKNPKSSLVPQNDAQLFQKVQTENLELQTKLKELQGDRQALFDKFKTSEQMKQVHEKEIIKIRNDTNLNRKIIQEVMTKVLNESSRSETDEQDESSGQIVFVRGENGSKQVKGATVEKLIERLTIQNAYDAQYQAAFLLTFRSFSTPIFFLDILIKKYRAADVDMNPSLTAQATQNPVHLRICKIIKTWIENYFEDFKSNKDSIMDKLNAFIQELEQNNKSKLAPLIKTALNRKVNPGANDQPEKNNLSQPKPKPIMPRPLAAGRKGSTIETDKLASATSLLSVTVSNKEKTGTKAGFVFGSKHKTADDEYKLTDLDPLEVARQLTLIEYEYFTAIKPTEFLDQAWMKEDKEIRAPNICQMTKWSNHVTHWLVSEIVSVKDAIRSRAIIYERIIMIAHHLEKLNNFNGVKEVLAALQSSSVYRLKKTQESVGNKYLKIYEHLMKLTSIEFNFKNLRSKVHASDPPLIVFPGIYQSDLVFMDTCNKSKLDNGLINFMKHQKIASYILELQVYQQTPYNLESVSDIADYIRNYPVLDENEAYNASLICEPRGS